MLHHEFQNPHQNIGPFREARDCGLYCQQHYHVHLRVRYNVDGLGVGVDGASPLRTFEGLIRVPFLMMRTRRHVQPLVMASGVVGEQVGVDNNHVVRRYGLVVVDNG